MNNSEKSEINNSLELREVLKENEKLRQILLYKSEEVDRLKNAFLANVSHEIRTPMNAIMGFSSLLNDPDLNAEERSVFVDGIHSSSRTLLNLIDKIIESAKLETEKVPSGKEFVLVDNVLNDLKLKFQDELNHYDDKNIQLEFTNEHKKKLKIISDEHKLVNILSNLIENAIKFTKSGSINIGYKLLNNKEIQFFVRDTGMGIPGDRIHRIFDKFSQVDENHRRKHAGLGVGLSISKELTKSMGGSISVNSDLGKGSTFYVTIPCEIIEDKVPLMFGNILEDKNKRNNILKIPKIYSTREKIAPEFSHTSRVNNSRA